jgi:prepilin-type N-terminal cleavage/methylation domain-containing protein
MCSKGFTLLELLIAMAITGILLAFAVNNYYNYVLRARMVELLSFANTAQQAVAEYYFSKGVMPNNNNEATFTPLRESDATYVPNKSYEARYKFVSIVTNGKILMYDYLFNFDLSKRQLVQRNLVIAILKPSISSDGGMIWECGVPGDIISDVEKYYQYLPATCRNIINYFE